MLIRAGKDIQGSSVYTAAYLYRTTTAWQTLSDHEKQAFTLLAEKKEQQQNRMWAAQAEEILHVLCSSVPMQPCAEDLGVKPPALPEVLKKLHIFSLRVFRWERLWQKDGCPFIPLDEYPEEAVAATSVHDCSTMRQWWEAELSYADMLSFFDAVHIDAAARKDLCPVEGEKPPYTERIAYALLSALVKVPSRFAVFPIQDWLALIGDQFPTITPEDERINVPGSVSEANWAYRLPAPIETLSGNKELIQRVQHITALRNGEDKK